MVGSRLSRQFLMELWAQVLFGVMNRKHGKGNSVPHLGPQQRPRRSNVSQLSQRLPPWLASNAGHPFKQNLTPLHPATIPLLSLDSWYHHLRRSEMSRVQLQNIPALTFYKDTLTAARRTDPIPQLTCIGKACKLYQPEAIRCTNAGGSGNNVDWKVRSVALLDLFDGQGGIALSS